MSGVIGSGIFLDYDAVGYFEDPCPTPSLNQSLIPDLLRKSPYHAAFRHCRLNPYGPGRESSRAQWLGEAAHRIALGRGRGISEIRYRDYSSTSARENRDEAVRNNRIPVLTHELVSAKDMAAVIKDMIAQEFEGKRYYTEVMICWQEDTAHGPIWCRGLVDAYCPELAYILDPKALRGPATPEAFGPTAAKFGYDLQDAWYRRGFGRLQRELEGRFKFANLVIENTAPHGSRAFSPDGGSRHIAEGQVKEAIELWGKCLYTNSWPQYPRETGTYTTPPWYQQAAMYRDAYDES